MFGGSYLDDLKKSEKSGIQYALHTMLLLYLYYTYSRLSSVMVLSAEHVQQQAKKMLEF